MEMDSNNKTSEDPLNEPLEEGYFICPNCGEKDLEFFNEVLIRKITKKQYNQLSDEQKLYINKKYEYGVQLCEACFYKAKRRSWQIKALYLLGLILLYINTLAGFCYSIAIMFVEKYYRLTGDFDFEHAWKCHVVKPIP